MGEKIIDDIDIDDGDIFGELQNLHNEYMNDRAKRPGEFTSRDYADANEGMSVDAAGRILTRMEKAGTITRRRASTCAVFWKMAK